MQGEEAAQKNPLQSELPIDFSDLAILLILESIFLVLCSSFLWFTLDDAYIGLRYSKHLANGKGIVWNVGEDPVEGYTSFLWVLLGSVPILIGIDPVIFLKAVSLLAGVVTIATVYLYSRKFHDNWVVSTLAAGAIAVSPGYALVAVQGMETAVTALLLLFSSILSHQVAETNERSKSITLGVSMFMAFLARPDTIVFSAVTLIILLAFLSRKSLHEGITFFVYQAIFFGLPIGLYMIWRYQYFGYLLPNPVYIKSGEQLLSMSGISYVTNFGAKILGPYVLLVLIDACIVSSKDKKGLRFALQEKIWNRSNIPLTGLLALLVIYCFIDPVQGFLYRFQFPVLASSMIIFSQLMSSSCTNIQRNYKSIVEGFTSRRNWSLYGFVALSIFTILLPFHTLDDAFSESYRRNQFDRVIVGKNLAALSKKNYTMFVSESGALPYFSEWTAYDYLGLNSEEIAHNKVTVQFIREINPELIMVKGLNSNSIEIFYPEAHQYILQESYLAVAAIRKSEYVSHVYFVKPGSSMVSIAETILGIDELEYANPEDYVGEGISIYH